MNITALDEVRESTGNTLTTVSGKKTSYRVAMDTTDKTVIVPTLKLKRQHLK